MTTPSSNVGADASRGHTPGPWLVTISDVRGTLCVQSSDAWICGELSNGRGMPTNEASANARLIAAAPELLEALESAEAVIDYAASILWNCRPEGRRARPAKVDASLRQFRAAIAKAKGGAK